MNNSIIPTESDFRFGRGCKPRRMQIPAGLVSYENANAKESETISYMKKYQESAFSIRLGLKFSSQ
ncbi:MAG TPA: hypothetical protein DEF33_05685 [Clostridiales bacterium]|nr:hypothetical protein [Clostridiales bacterium]